MRLQLLATLTFAEFRLGTSLLVFRGHSQVLSSNAQIRPALTYAAASSSDAASEPPHSTDTIAADEALSGALTALGDSDVKLAQELLGAAMAGYRAAGLVDERAPLVAMVKKLACANFIQVPSELLNHPGGIESYFRSVFTSVW